MRALPAFLLLAACAPGRAAPDLAAPGPRFDPALFFAGGTEGDGRLHVLFSGTDRFRVDGTGRTEDGELVLTQTVCREGHKPERREWRMRETAPGVLSGTLSDATGPVSGEIEGNLLHLRYAVKGGLRAEQWLYLAPDGTRAENRMQVSKWGIRIARIDETIRRVAQPRAATPDRC